MVAQRKPEIPLHLSVTVGEDRRIVIDLPPDTPIGPAQIALVLRPAEVTETPQIVNPAREAARAKLLAAGKLSTIWRALEGYKPLSVDERMVIGTLPANAPSSEQLVNEDRGEY